MLQVVQHLQSGKVEVVDAPIPVCIEKGILVKNLVSVISPGTEKASISTTQASLLEKAKKQPQQIQNVLENLRREGIRSTINKVLTKLDSFKTFGYSSCGLVIETKSELFSVGDLVACGGAGYATHSEFITVPQNLACHVPKGVIAESGAFATIGAIALQSLRQAKPQLGEYVAVIGLGLLGLIVVQLLKANGCQVVGLDIRPDNFDLAKHLGCDKVSVIDSEIIPELISFTNGNGFDSVIISASTKSNEPTEFSLRIVRKKGKIVVLGDVGMNLPRSPFYEKELEFTISCSYGPGRYDKFYEEYGIDYPYAYVRWTEKRNMQAFLELLQNQKISIEPLITHRFPIEEAIKAYELLTNGNEKYIGIVLQYSKELLRKETLIVSPAKKIKQGKHKIGFIGAGSFAQFYILPVLKNLDVELQTVVNATSTSALTVSKHFGFRYASTNPSDIFNDPKIDFVFIATRHNTHADLVLESIKFRKPVFVEKPLTLTFEELTSLKKAYNNSPVPLMVGYNRRFSQAFQHINKEFENRKQPIFMHYRINAGEIPPDHWIQNPNIGGGRIIGEVCHFIDTMQFLTKSNPTSVFAEALSHNMENRTLWDTITITIKFDDGSVGVIEYLANGSPQVPKEYFEIYCENKTAILNNFHFLSIFTNKEKKINLNKSKGHKEEIEATLSAFARGFSPIEFESLILTSLATFAIQDSLITGTKIILSEYKI
ncbi:MAG: bi-domain-containing oxidoreductase [Candidatus Kapaibacteriales bacterium]